MKADPNKKTLIIVESPTKAKTIKKYLPQSCTVMASKGHILDLAKNPKTGTYGVDTSDGYQLEYEMPDDKKKLLSEMKRCLKDCEQLVLASDEDREGESISYHLFQELKPKCPVYRMVFHEITRQAITNAFDSCREIDMNLVHAQEARRAVDRLQGYGISPIISKKLGSAYSAGRVQSPGLKLLVDKEKERRAFKKSDYTGVDIFFSDFKARLVSINELAVASKNSFDPLTGKVKEGYVVLDAVASEKVSQEIKGTIATVADVEENEKKQMPAIPFTTSTLQQDASRKMRTSVRRVMQIAQSLYEKGYITYMRTDSPTLSSECINASRKQIEMLYGASYLSEKVRNYKSKSASAQEAHEAIRPAGDTFRLPKDTGLEGDELKLYTIIWKRTVATQMAEAVKKTTSIKLKDGIYGFASSGTVVLFDGFLRVYREDTDEDEDDLSKLPALKRGDERAVEDVVLDSHTTEPPMRYNEATLVKTLEAEGIGRPSTYATIISTILDRKYAVKVGSSLVPTFTGFFVSNLLESTFPVYIGYNFTSEMEKGLDDIAEGKIGKKDYLDAFWLGKDDFSGLKTDMGNVSRTVRISSAKMLTLPGLDNSFMLDGRKVCYEIRIGKFGPYLVSDYQDEDGKERMAGIDQEKYFPGTFTDEDAKDILFKKEDPDYIPSTDIRILEGRWGKYLKRDSDQKAVNLPKSMDPAKLSKEDALLIMSLPVVIGQDEQGNEALLKLGPYGYYASYKGKNIRVRNPHAVKFEDVIMPEDKQEKSTNAVIKEFSQLEGKPLQILSGRYGAYIKWGTKNCALPKDEKSNPEAISEERAKEIALSAPEGKKTFRKKKA